MGNLGPLHLAPFVKAIKLMGKVPVAWMRHDGPCPNCTDEDGNPTTNLSCALCGGTGAVYSDRTLPTTGLTGGKILFSQAQIGTTRAPIELLSGDVMCSYLEGSTEYALGEGDRLVLPTREHRFTELRVYAAGGDELRRYPVTRIQAVYEGDALVAPASYSVGSDDRTLTFTAGVAAGDLYAVSYWFRPSFAVVGGSIHHREFTGDDEPFPARCVLRQFQQSPLDVKAGGY